MSAQYVVRLIQVSLYIFFRFTFFSLLHRLAVRISLLFHILISSRIRKLNPEILGGVGHVIYISCLPVCECDRLQVILLRADITGNNSIGHCLTKGKDYFR